MIKFHLYPKPSIRSLKSSVTFGWIENGTIRITATISTTRGPIRIRCDAHFCTDPSSRTFCYTFTVEDYRMRLKFIQESRDWIFQTGCISTSKKGRQVCIKVSKNMYVRRTRHQTRSHPNHHILSTFRVVAARQSYRMFVE